MSIVDSVRKPEYTGENRCIPCTAVNAVIAVLSSAGLAAGLVAAGQSTPVAAGAGTGLLVVSLAAIYLRGYLVPGTPELTKRYFPDWVLAKFDKLPEEPAVAGTAEADAELDAETDAGDDPVVGESDPDLDPERALLSAGAVEGCQNRDDLCLAEEFGDAWRERIHATQDDGVDTEDILSALDMEDLVDEASLSQFGDAVVLERAGKEIGKWESQAALVADVTAAEELAGRYDRWGELNGVDRSKLLRGLRIFVEECPLCDGPIEMGQDTVESCCRSYDVVAVTCGDCGSRLFEERWDGAA